MLIRKHKPKQSHFRFQSHMPPAMLTVTFLCHPASSYRDSRQLDTSESSELPNLECLS